MKVIYHSSLALEAESTSICSDFVDRDVLHVQHRDLELEICLMVACSMTAISRNVGFSLVKPRSLRRGSVTSLDRCMPRYGTSRSSSPVTQPPLTLTTIALEQKPRRIRLPNDATGHLLNAAKLASIRELPAVSQSTIKLQQPRDSGGIEHASSRCR